MDAYEWKIANGGGYVSLQLRNKIISSLWVSCFISGI